MMEEQGSYGFDRHMERKGRRWCADERPDEHYGPPYRFFGGEMAYGYRRNRGNDSPGHEWSRDRLERAAWGRERWYGYDSCQGRETVYGSQRLHSDLTGRRRDDLSDERLREQVSERLADSAEIDASDVDVQVSNGEVTLIGLVSSHSERRSALTLIEGMPGVVQVINHLHVRGSLL